MPYPIPEIPSIGPNNNIQPWCEDDANHNPDNEDSGEDEDVGKDHRDDKNDEEEDASEEGGA